MTEYRKQKQEFVRDYLQPLLVKATNHEVNGVVYSETPDGDEIVTIYTGYGAYKIDVRVNMDSPMAICRDVFRALGDF